MINTVFKRLGENRALVRKLNNSCMKLNKAKMSDLL